jgi:hypothetical protein
MGRGLAIIGAGALIAAAILITNHWSVVFNPGDLVQMVRFNRWTGAAEICWIEPDTVKGKSSLAGAKYRCGDLPR